MKIKEELGAYTIPEEQYVVSPFYIPDHWPRCYGFDSFNILLAYDKDNDVIYIDKSHTGRKDR